MTAFLAIAVVRLLEECEVDEMTPIIVIAAFVVIVVVLKKLFNSSGNTRSSYSHYTSSDSGRSNSLPSKNKSSSQQKISPSELQHAQYLAKQLSESTNIVNHTTNPKTYFGRLHFLFDTLMAMTEYEKYGIYTGGTPTEDLHKLNQSLESSVNDFINRSYEAQMIKVCSLKTQQGKMSSMKKYFDSRLAAFDHASSFWSGDNMKPHYTGKLFTDNNKAYLISLYEDCKQAYSLEGDGNAAIAPESKTPKLVFDLYREKELLKEYRKYAESNADDAYYAALPLIDFYYKYRSLDEKYLKLCMKYCNICISLLPSPEMQKYVSDGICIPAFKKLVIIYDKKKEYKKALAIIDEAVKFDREVEYYEKKKATILKKMNK